MNSSTARCVIVPTPADAYMIGLGYAFAGAVADDRRLSQRCVEFLHHDARWDIRRARRGQRDDMQ